MLNKIKIVQINTTCGVGSTGVICVDISKCLTKANIENYIFYGCTTNGYEKGIASTKKGYVRMQSLKSHVLGNYGFNSYNSTKQIIKSLERINPDIVHLHNIHGQDWNLQMLFEYFSSHNIKIVWTFHDCWAFTGYCPHFTMTGCEKWKKICDKCIQFREYSFFFDRSKGLFQKKKELFKELNMTIVTPSNWLASIVKESFLKDYTVEIINNGIDLDLFKPTISNFKAKYKIEKNKKVILGVAFGWSIKKGIDVFVELANRLDKKQYQIVLVGTDDAIDKMLPKSIVSIHRTQNQRELAEIYTASDIFINASKEENYPTVIMEAIACGTPVITFDVGGSAEIIGECGRCIQTNDVEDLIDAIQNFAGKEILEELCLNKRDTFDKNQKYQNYLELYRSLYDRVTEN